MQLFIFGAGSLHSQFQLKMSESNVIKQLGFYVTKSVLLYCGGEDVRGGGAIR